MVLKVYDRIEKIVEDEVHTFSLLTLPFELRKKSRLKAKLDDGTEVGLILSRGELLRGGDYLCAENKLIIKIVAAQESVSTITHKDNLMLMRASYHLGNRHVPLQINNAWVRYEHDHVLDEMVKGLGLNVSVETAPFEPEAGAYGGGHKHGDDDEHTDSYHQNSHAH